MPKGSVIVSILTEFISMDVLNTIAVKVLAFWPDSAKVWLVQMKAQFVLKGVTVSATKFLFLQSRNWKSSSRSQQISSSRINHPGSEEVVAQTFCTWWLPEVWSYFQSAFLRRHETFQAHVKNVNTPPRWSQTLFLPSWSLSQMFTDQHQSSSSQGQLRAHDLPRS